MNNDKLPETAPWQSCRDEQCRTFRRCMSSPMPCSVEHYLKVYPEFWEAMNSRGKTFELRQDDRAFEVGDMLVLEEWSPETADYTGRRQFRRVRYILRGGQFGLERGYICMGLS